MVIGSLKRLSESTANTFQRKLKVSFTPKTCQLCGTTTGTANLITHPSGVTRYYQLSRTVCMWRKLLVSDSILQHALGMIFSHFFCQKILHTCLLVIFKTLN